VLSTNSTRSKKAISKELTHEAELRVKPWGSCRAGERSQLLSDH
jgi:hypothetical protein